MNAALTKGLLIGIGAFALLTPSAWPMAKGRIAIQAAEQSQPNGRNGFHEFEQACFDLQAKVQAVLDRYASLNGLPLSQFSTVTRVEPHYAESFRHVSSEDCSLVVRTRDQRAVFSKFTSKPFLADPDCRALFDENARKKGNIVFQRIVHDPKWYGPGTRDCRVRWIEVTR